jgi:hypothetical protein
MQGLSSLGPWRDLEGRDPPPGCEEGDAGIPWHRASDAKSSWQYWLLLILSIAATLLLGSTSLARHRDYALPLLVGGAALLAASLVAGLLLWVVV